MVVRLAYVDGTKEFVSSLDEAFAAIDRRNVGAVVKILSMTVEEMDAELDRIEQQQEDKHQMQAAG